MQRRRRLEQDRDLMLSLKKKSDDLAVLVEWAEAGEPVDAEFAQGLEALDQEVQAGEIKKMLGGEHDRKNAIITIHPGAGGTESQDWAEMLLRMYMRWTERRGFKREIIDYQPGEEAGLKSATVTVTGEYAYGLLVRRGRRPPARAHLAVRSGGAPAHVVRLALRLARAARGRRHRDRRQGPPHRHVPIERRRRPARQRHRLGDPHHPPADRPRGVVPERALAAPQQGLGDEGAEGAALRHQDEGEPGEARSDRRREEGDRRSAARSAATCCTRIRWSRITGPRSQVGDVNRVLDGDIDVFIKTYLMKKSNGTLGQAAPDDDLD